MTGLEIAFIAELIRLGLKAAPDVAAFLSNAQNHVQQLFLGKLITKEQADSLAAFIDELNEARLNGEVDPAWTVEPDPE